MIIIMMMIPINASSIHNKHDEKKPNEWLIIGGFRNTSLAGSTGVGLTLMQVSAKELLLSAQKVLR